MSPTPDLTTLPSDTSPASVAAHIKSIENSINEQLMDVENVKTANSHLQQKIENINQQLAEARDAIQSKILVKKKLEEEIVQAERVMKQLKGTSGELVEKVKHNDAVGEKSLHAVTQGKNLIKLLTNLSRSSAKATLQAAGKYQCVYCGTAHYREDKELHAKKCWGRCKRCRIEKLECDCGRDHKFMPCRNCNKAGKDCEKMAPRREQAKGYSVLKGV